jgi:hypothetical protein
MKNLILKSTMLLATAAVMVYGAQAQSIKVSIPFAFEANGKSMPAGDYVVVQTDRLPGTYIMRSATGHDSVLLANRQTIADARGQAKLVFMAAPDAYYLTEVWDGEMAHAVRSPHFKSGLLAAPKSVTRVEIAVK